MNKAEFIKYLAGRIDYMSPAQVEAAVKSLITIIQDELKDNQRIEIRNFGCFEVKQLPSRNSVNPKTGESISISERRIVRFKAGKALKNLVNDSKDKE